MIKKISKIFLKWIVYYLFPEIYSSANFSDCEPINGILGARK